MSNNHNHYSNLIEFKDIDFCMSKGRVSKKLVEKLIERKNEENEKLTWQLNGAVELLKTISDTDWSVNSEDYFFNVVMDCDIFLKTLRD